MAENVRVVVRCRPMNAKEYAMGSQNILKIERCTLYITNPLDANAPPKAFTFDNVYDGAALTEAIYQDICYALVENVLEGYNGTIFAYGQTGCGKTHTMQGIEMQTEMTLMPPATPATPATINTSTISTTTGTVSTGVMDNDRGIIVRCFEHIFETIALARNVRYLAIISYLEIYNENIRDLLQTAEQQQQPIVNHQLKELPNVGVVVPTLSTHTVHNANECYQLLCLGNRNRMVAATMMNATSSRSHTIFSICLEQIKCDDNQQNGVVGVGGGGDADVDLSLVTQASSIRCGKLNLVDLAGSERQNKTGAVGERLREAMKINLSLSALGNVISALVDGKTKHIPYRDSKLTRLLQDSLGGNTKTLMISCISPAASNYDETISTLRYASRAKNIANKPRINEDPKDAKLREYQEEIDKLRVLLQQATTAQTAMPAPQSQSQSSPSPPPAQQQQQQQPPHEQQQQVAQEPILNANDERTPLHKMTSANASVTTTTTTTTIAPATATAAESATAIELVDAATLQLETRKRIEAIKRTLIGGELANDAQLRARRQKKKLDAQRRLSALAHALSRIVQREDRDLLQVHYANTQQEIDAKNAQLKEYRQRIRALETEVGDVQAEFQVDRVDYLDAIRKLERQLKFHQQLVEKALPILRKMGKYWDPDDIIRNSCWNDDLKIWLLPESAMNSLRFPPANGRSALGGATSTTGPVPAVGSTPSPNTDATDLESEMQQQQNTSAYIINNYFRMPRMKFNTQNNSNNNNSSSANNATSLAAATAVATNTSDGSDRIENNVIDDRQQAKGNFIEQYFRRSNILHTANNRDQQRSARTSNAAAAPTTTTAAASNTTPASASSWFKMQQMANKLPHSAWHPHSTLTHTPNHFGAAAASAWYAATRTAHQTAHTDMGLLNNTWSGRNSTFMLLPAAASAAAATVSTTAQPFNVPKINGMPFIKPIEHTRYNKRHLPNAMQGPEIELESESECQTDEQEQLNS